MKTLPIAVLLLLAAALPVRAQEARLDLSGIDRIEITGDAAALDLTARPGDAREARLTTRRSGWFSRWYSSWFYNDCRSASRMWTEGTVLHVAVAQPSAFESSDCEVALSASLPPGVAVRIGLAAVQARLDGRFSTLDVDARAGDVALAGAADEARLRGAALRARLDLADGPAPRRVSLEAGALDAAVTLAAGARVGWRVDAKAALVDTARPNDADARTQVDVTGDYVRLALR